MLEVCSVSKKFGHIQALDNVSFTLQKGKITALLGENGAGKSTLLRIISGYFDADEGSVKMDNLNIANDRIECLQKIAYVREVSNIYSELTVYEFLRFAADIHCIKEKISDEHIKKIINLMQLDDVIYQKSGTLSKGFKKRLDVAAALVAKPEILLLDEPTEGLDPNQKNVLRSLICKLAKDCMILISTHTMEDVEKTANCVLLLHKGKLLKNCSLAEFKKISRDNDLLSSFIKITER